MHLGRRVWARQWWGGKQEWNSFPCAFYKHHQHLNVIRCNTHQVPVFRLLITQFGRWAELLLYQNEGGAHGSSFVDSVLPTSGGRSFDLTVWLPEISYFVGVGHSDDQGLENMESVPPPFQCCMRHHSQTGKVQSYFPTSPWAQAV